MSPTIFRARGYRFYFFSREESRMHVFIMRRARPRSGLEPEIMIAQNYGLSPARFAAALRLVQEHENEIRAAWQTHFGG